MKFVAVGLFLGICGHALPNYKEDEAINFAQLARVSFCEKSAIESWKCGDMCDAISPPPSKAKLFGPGRRWQVQGYVAKMADTSCVLAFRGSITSMNWIADFLGVDEPWPLMSSSDKNSSWCSGCRAHTGFALAYQELRTDMFALLTEFQCSKIAIAGHSLGAAVATLAVAELRSQSDVVVDPVYIYGAPRVGNPTFVKKFTELASKGGYEVPLWRVVHYHDPVPLLCPTSTAGGYLDYLHVSEEVQYNEKSTFYQVCDPTPSGGENPTCSFKTHTWQEVNMDHITYLNLTFAHKKMDPLCTGHDRNSNGDASELDTVVIV